MQLSWRQRGKRNIRIKCNACSEKYTWKEHLCQIAVILPNLLCENCRMMIVPLPVISLWPCCLKYMLRALDFFPPSICPHRKCQCKIWLQCEMLDNFLFKCFQYLFLMLVSHHKAVKKGSVCYVHRVFFSSSIGQHKLPWGQKYYWKLFLCVSVPWSNLVGPSFFLKNMHAWDRMPGVHMDSAATIRSSAASTTLSQYSGVTSLSCFPCLPPCSSFSSVVPKGKEEYNCDPRPKDKGIALAKSNSLPKSPLPSRVVHFHDLDCVINGRRPIIHLLSFPFCFKIIDSSKNYI